MKIKPKEYISTRLVTVKFNDGLESAYIKMRNHKIRHLPVVDDQGRIIGIISDRDIQRGMESDTRDFESYRVSSADFDPAAKVWDYMSTPVKAVPYETDLKTISQRMIDEKISAFLISREDTIVGIVTTEDLLRVLNKLLTHEDEHGLFENVQKWFYKTPIGEISNSLSNAGI